MLSLATATAATWLCFYIFLFVRGLDRFVETVWLHNTLTDSDPFLQVLPSVTVVVGCILFGTFGLLYAASSASTHVVTACILLSVVMWALLWEVILPQSATEPTQRLLSGRVNFPLCMMFGATFGYTFDPHIAFWKRLARQITSSCRKLLAVIGEIELAIGSLLFGGLTRLGQGLTAVGTAGRNRYARLDEYALMRMTSQLGTMLRAGVGLIRALDALAHQELNPPLKRALDNVADDLTNRGLTFWKAMAKHPKIFSPFYLGLVKLGEATGTFDNSLLALARYIERDLNLIRRARAAMLYPAFVLVVAVTVVWGIFVWVIPQLLATFTSLAGDDATYLPLPTRVLQSIVTVCSNPRAELTFVACVAVTWLFVQEFYKTPGGKYLIDKWKVSLPVIGKFNQQVLLANFFRSLGTLMAQGVPILQSLNILIECSGNEYFKRTTLMEVMRKLKDGVSLTKIFQLDPIFPSISQGMVQVGDESGAMPEMLLRLADLYDETVTRALSTLVTLIEPVMIVAMGILVAFVLVGVFLPLYNIVVKLT